MKKIVLLEPFKTFSYFLSNGSRGTLLNQSGPFLRCLIFSSKVGVLLQPFAVFHFMNILLFFVLKCNFSRNCSPSAAVWPFWPAYLSLVACLGLSSFLCYWCKASVALQPFAIFYFLITSAMFVWICWYSRNCYPSAAVWPLRPSCLAFVAMLLIWSVFSQ